MQKIFPNPNLPPEGEGILRSIFFYRTIVRKQGFTLIELLVVLLLISIVSTAVLFTINPNQNRQIETFSKDLIEVLNFAEEEAMLKPAILRVVFTPHEFIFYQYDFSRETNSNWVELNDNILGKHQIPDFMQITVKVKGAEFENANPQIVISSSGDVTPFTIYVGKRGEKPRYAIIGEVNGYISSKLLQ